MKKTLLVIGCWLFALGSVSAQITSGELNNIVDQFNQNSPRHRVNLLFPLADELMLMESFDNLPVKLMKSKSCKFTSVNMISEGSLKAESDICELYAVNRLDRPEKIDTLTLYVKYALDKNVLTDSLKNANYVFKQTSSDGRFDWWQHKVSGINLAVYYKYSKKYPSAMLFARPKKDVRDVITRPVQPETPVEEEVEGERPVATPITVSFQQAKISQTLRQRGTEKKIEIVFPKAVGTIAVKLNNEALRSHLLGHFVAVKPQIADDMSIEDGLKAYFVRMSSEFLAEFSEVNDIEQTLENKYTVEVLPENETRKGVITYVNNVSIVEPDIDPSTYRVVSNFDAKTGKLLTFDDVFKQNSKAAIIGLLKKEHQKNIAEYEEFAGEVDYEDALKNFILKPDGIDFILITGDESGPYEEVYPYKYEALKKYLR
jgi:hypothetical protein